jgi:hypothetical protein
MLTHTFRGTSIKSLLGLESDLVVFQRYRNLRSAERVYLKCSNLSEQMCFPYTPTISAAPE